MKNSVSIFLLVLYLLGTTELHELLRLPLLVEHFMEHRRADNQMSFFDFMNLHYAQGVVQDEDYEKDKRLPFKTHDFCSNSPLSHPFHEVVVVTQPSSPYLFPNIKRLTPHGHYDAVFYSSNYLDNIWQPPQTY